MIGWEDRMEARIPSTSCLAPEITGMEKCAFSGLFGT